MKRARLFKATAASVAIAVLVAAVFHFSGDALLNRFLRPKLEQACFAHLPGSSLRLGALHYDVWHNRLRCDSVAMTRPDGAPASTGAISAKGVNWRRLLADKCDAAQLFSGAQVEV